MDVYGNFTEKAEDKKGEQFVRGSRKRNFPKKNNIRSLRLSKGYTIRDLAGLLNVSAQAVSAWEHGISNPKHEYVLKLCDVFGVTADDIVWYEAFEKSTSSSDRNNATHSMIEARQNKLTGRSPLDGYFEPLITVATLKEFIDRKDYVLYEVVNGEGVVRVPVSEPIPEEYLDYKVVRMHADHHVIHIQITPRYFVDAYTKKRTIYHTHHRKQK